MQEVMVEVRKNWLSEELRIYLKLADEYIVESKKYPMSRTDEDGRSYLGRAKVLHYVIWRLAWTSNIFDVDEDNVDDFCEHGGIEKLRVLLNVGV